MTQTRHSRRIHQPNPAETSIGSAFLRALAKRVDANPTGKLTLPTGPAEAAEVRKLLAAIDLARAHDGRGRKHDFNRENPRPRIECRKQKQR